MIFIQHLYALSSPIKQHLQYFEHTHIYAEKDVWKDICCSLCRLVCQRKRKDSINC